MAIRKAPSQEVAQHLLNYHRVSSPVSTDLCYYGYCKQNGTCLNIKGSPVCFCPEKFAGDRCQYQDFCLLNDSCDKNHGHCSMIDAEKWQCDCKDGRSGDDCFKESLGPSQCANVTCMNGGTCYHNSTTIDDTYCVCDDQHYGPFCENVVTCKGVVCHNGGTCNEYQGETVCLCSIGWRGRHCNISKDNDPCGEQDRQACLNGGLCVTDSEEKVFCTCNEGFVGAKCENEEMKNAKCANWNCLNGGNCTENGSVAICHCDAGWHGDLCEKANEKDPCGEGDQPVCLNGGVCNTDSEEKVFCTCKEGFVGAKCEYEDPCVEMTCKNGEKCSSRSGVAYCPCDDAKLHGAHCKPNVDNVSCRSVTCMNGGQCLALKGEGAKCECPPEFTGAHCETKIPSPCANLTCLNGGNCSDTGGVAICHCDAEWYGDNCEKDVDNVSCRSVKCMNGGQCLALKGEGAKCECPPEFTGAHCETKIPSPCANLTCLNGGNCSDTGGVAICHCDAEWYGDNCDKGDGASSLGMGITVGIPVALVYLSLTGLTGVFIIWKITQNRRAEPLLAEPSVSMNTLQNV
ncbi:protein lin-12-like [Asterias amurensis]|uniref:protein lin-12-like n=1 Tax=Asterias amurensis TaxID=7602 RepID=UPI003AB153DF